jgi:hypothetical protein
MGEMTTPQPLIIIIWTCHEMMAWMRKELIGFVDVIMLDFDYWKLGKWQLIFALALTTNPTQHDSHGPDDYPKTFDYHHLDMSRDDVMDENGIDWFFGCHHVGFCIMEDEEIS